MKNLLLSATIGDIAGSAYEFNPNKNYDEIELFHPIAEFTDDTVMTFACAEALIHKTDMTQTMWSRGNQFPYVGYGGHFYMWLKSRNPQPYGSYGNGSAMRCSAAGWLAKTEEECIQLATEIALPTHNHEEGIKGAVITALTIFRLKQGKDKDFIRTEILEKYYPNWAEVSYDDFHDDYSFDVTCQGSVGPAIICFLESTSYVDCIKLAIALGGDADTLADIAGPMAYAYYKEIPEDLIEEAKKKITPWMLELNDEFDNYVATINTEKRISSPRIDTLQENEIFVFGSNLKGMHGGGAARVAVDKFGAIWGQGVGLQGQSYAIPTMHGGVDEIKPYVDEFIAFAKEHQELKFLVTRIGCGIAGFTDEEMAPLFEEAKKLINVWLPKSFWK